MNFVRTIYGLPCNFVLHWIIRERSRTPPKISCSSELQGTFKYLGRWDDRLRGVAKYKYAEVIRYARLMCIFFDLFSTHTYAHTNMQLLRWELRHEVNFSGIMKPQSCRLESILLQKSMFFSLQGMCALPCFILVMYTYLSP